MSPPSGFETQFLHQGCKLQKCLYGLKQLPKPWFDRKATVLIVYVDDIALSGDDPAKIIPLKKRMGMLGCHHVDTPIEFNNKLGNSYDKVSSDKEQYQCLMDKLIYLFHTQPNISFTVSIVNQKMDKKTIEAYNDSDWARSIVHRKTTSGYCTFVWGNLITWKSKKQGVIARSSVEAEYRAMSLRICEEIWLHIVLYDLHQKCKIPMKLFCDNKAAISIANNPVQHDRTKHVEKR
ncbi:putative mitochondrial protein [Cucumis melo var. makuwa]|uniref:Mitochondrial protein n=1 Tax=Cucumis melo var. makuwa TaxID=1194695 RepID=A0A5D3DV56_CUCMM|nr:putative mitochondrial protein [Cucumis melo var. makuwa]TYK27378.1 putative mitochondrial protein [Cucumis melo var. makuwa]